MINERGTEKNDNKDKNTQKDSEIWFCTLCTKDLFPFNSFDEDIDFYEALFELRVYDETVPLDKLISLVRDKVFNPFELNDDIKETKIRLK